MPRSRQLLDSILIKHDMAVNDAQEHQEFRKSLRLLIDAGCSYSRIGRVFGYERATVRNWDVLNIMPMDPVVVKKIISAAKEIKELQRKIGTVRISEG